MDRSNEQLIFFEVEQAKRMEALSTLWRAVEQDDPDTVIRVSYDCDHKMPNVDGRTALMYAAWLGHAECAERLAYYRIKPDVQARDNLGRTALHWAAAGGNPLCVHPTMRMVGVEGWRSHILLKDADGKTALDIALDMGRYSVVDKILAFIIAPEMGEVARTCVLPRLQENPFGVISSLASHAELREMVAKHVASLGREERDWRGCSALHLAAMVGAYGAVKKMLASGHDPQALNTLQATPLIACAQSIKFITGEEPWVKTAKLLIPVSDVYWADHEGKTALMHAANNLNQAMTEALIHHSDVNAMDNRGDTAASLAFKRGMASSVGDFLWCLTMRHDYIRRSSNKDIQGKNFRRLAQDGDVAKLTKMLYSERKRGDEGNQLDKFAFDCDQLPLVLRQDKYGTTALMVAAKHGHASCVEVLLDRGADPLARDTLGMSSLMYAVGGGHLACARLLIPRSHVDAKNIYGRTALGYAYSNGRENLFAELGEVARQDILKLDR